MSAVMRLGLTDVGIGILLNLINCLLPEPVLPSLYMFLKVFPDLTNVTKHFYCPDCEQSVRFDVGDPKECECGKSNNRRDLEKRENFFLTMPLADKVQKLLEDREIARHLNESEDISDVQSGLMYRKLKRQGFIGPDDMTFQFNTDGAAVFHSSKIADSLWAIQVAVNELPYRIRKNNLILAGLWLGDSAPRMDVYLRPFIDELKQLEMSGILCNIPGKGETLVKCHCILGILDSTARPKVEIKFC